ncbi:coiled-coil domain-containing protein 125 [Ictalurus punctatus]|uniref:Coiled-coil domain-containing protein 125 n=1 Tax=Ictalurus punctatus TaxID=7998 RepID=W5UTH3_ICTPU|nr:coiled-coil domain-containing protein 125 [Ictalurus punctatus]XP_017307117.1 coiled-coil domain-containing protein 125 [Ictalurus punctatus]XP_053530610.1 coiled-coil domain-containing protein 125 [Ictalurus punctatus]
MMHADQEQASTTDQPSEDDMAEGDLGDGTRSVAGIRKSRSRSKADFLDQMKWGSEGTGRSFSWTSCSAMYTAFRKELEAERISQWRIRDSESSAGESSEELQKRLQEVTEEVELLRSELEVTHRHLEGKHEALRILQGQAILDKATSHTKLLLQKSEERNKALEKEVNALQWEITFNQVQFKNLEHAWELKYDRVCAENQVLSKALDERLGRFQDLHRENTSLSQQCLELLGLLSAQERRDFQKTQPPCSQNREGSALELAVYGACKCSSSTGEPCSCAKSAAASRKQVLQLQQELELQRGMKDEAYVMVDAFRIAFEQQLRRGSEKVLQLAESDTHTPERGKQRSAGVTQALKRFLPSLREGKVPSNLKETLKLLLDLLSDKEEALAHQRKVSYMLARSYEDLEKRLQAQLKELDISHNGAESKPESDRSKCAADHSSCPCDNIPVVMDEREDKTRMAGSQNRASDKQEE